MSNESDYIVRNPKLVLSYLDDVIKKKCLISAHFGEKNSSFLTTIVALDKKNKLIMLDSAPTDALDNELLGSQKVLFRTEYEGIKVSFAGKEIKKVKTGNSWSFAMPVPSSLFWMQRRRFYRVKIPLSHTASYCQIVFKQEEEAGSEQTATFPLADLSITGLALFNPDPEKNDWFQIGREFVNCGLHIQSGGEATVACKIINITNVRASVTTEQLRVGCEFTYLPPGFADQIQRYMQEVELQLKNVG